MATLGMKLGVHRENKEIGLLMLDDEIRILPCMPVGPYMRVRDEKLA